MVIHRRLLYPGLLLVALGGVLVVADLAAVDGATLVDALRWWPLALVALGAGLALRRSALGLPAGVAAAVVPGLLLGSALAIAPRYADGCGTRGEPVAFETRSGTFSGPTDVLLTLGCGRLAIASEPGTGWWLSGDNTAGRSPVVSASPGSLEIRPAGWSAGHDGETRGWPPLFDGGRDRWTLALPTHQVARLSVAVNAGTAEMGLDGARVERLALTANGATVTVDASTASVAELAVAANFSAVTITLPATANLTATLRVGAGMLRVCAPPGLGLRVEITSFASDVTVAGLRHAGTLWESPGYASAAHRAELTVRANFGAIEIDPIGGCR